MTWFGICIVPCLFLVLFFFVSGLRRPRPQSPTSHSSGPAHLASISCPALSFSPRPSSFSLLVYEAQCHVNVEFAPNSVFLGARPFAKHGIKIAESRKSGAIVGSPCCIRMSERIALACAKWMNSPVPLCSMSTPHTVIGHPTPNRQVEPYHRPPSQVTGILLYRRKSLSAIK